MQIIHILNPFFYTIFPELKGKGKWDMIPRHLFSGYQILAYYYVMWKVAIPEMVASLQLPFEKEYELAKTMKD